MYTKMYLYKINLHNTAIDLKTNVIIKYESNFLILISESYLCPLLV